MEMIGINIYNNLTNWHLAWGDVWSLSTEVLYFNIIGDLMYLTQYTKSNISFAVNLLA